VSDGSSDESKKSYQKILEKKIFSRKGVVSLVIEAPEGETTGPRGKGDRTRKASNKREIGVRENLGRKSKRS